MFAANFTKEPNGVLLAVKLLIKCVCRVNFMFNLLRITLSFMCYKVNHVCKFADVTLFFILRFITSSKKKTKTAAAER